MGRPGKYSSAFKAKVALEVLRGDVAQGESPENLELIQGVQYTGHLWVSFLEEHEIKISMDGPGRCKDNIWIERFWRTINQEYIYLNPTKDVMELRSGIAKFMRYYNYERPYQSLELLLPARQYGIIVAA